MTASLRLQSSSEPNGESAVVDQTESVTFVRAPRVSSVQLRYDEGGLGSYVLVSLSETAGIEQA